MAKLASYLAENFQPGIEYVTVSTSPLQGVHKTSPLNVVLEFPHAAASSHFSYRRIERNVRETPITD